MTDEEILKLASEHFCCNMSVMEYSCREPDILKFARAIYDEGGAEGFKAGYDEGYDEGCCEATEGNGND